MSPALLAAIGAILFIVGFVSGTRRAQARDARTRGPKQQALLEEGKALQESGDHVGALMRFCEATGHQKHAYLYFLMGRSLESMETHRHAARAFGDAAWTAQFRRSPSDPEMANDPDVAFFYMRAASAYARIEDWKWAFEQAKQGIWAIGTGYPRYMKELDCESELRAIRMYAALYIKRGTDALKAAREDAAWIFANSECANHLDAARAMLQLTDIGLNPGHHFSEQSEEKPRGDPTPEPPEVG